MCTWGFTRQPENSKRAHLSAPAFQTPPKFHEKTPRERRKKENCGGRGEKTREMLALPTLRPPHPSVPPPFGPPTPRALTLSLPTFSGFGHPPFGAPPFRAPPFGAHPSGPHPSGLHASRSYNRVVELLNSTMMISPFLFVESHCVFLNLTTIPGQNTLQRGSHSTPTLSQTRQSPVRVSPQLKASQHPPSTPCTTVPLNAPTSAFIVNTT